MFGVALPFLEHLDPQVQEDRSAEQGFDLAPGGGADLSEPAPRWPMMMPFWESRSTIMDA